MASTLQIWSLAHSVCINQNESGLCLTLSSQKRKQHFLSKKQQVFPRGPEDIYFQMVSHADVRNTQLDDLSPLYWNLCNDHQHPVRGTQKHSAVQLCTSLAGTAGALVVMAVVLTKMKEGCQKISREP